jgi:uncharacterized protein (DUF1330 family)
VPAYLIADVQVTDPRASQEYREKVPAVIAANGGRYLVRGGAHQLLEGNAEFHRVIVLEFPNMAKLKAFYDSPEYQLLIELRQKSSRSSLLAVEGV